MPQCVAPELTMEPLKQRASSFLKTALDDPSATFRDGQWEAIARLIDRRERLLVVQRTGWGKSLIYFLATRLLRDRGAGPTLLISPLLALMRNQISAARRIDIKAATINSTNLEEWSRIERQLNAGTVDILLISPERLANENFRDNVLIPTARRIGLFVVDEAHCISDWGHDFRPDYRRILRVLQSLPSNIPVLATTATANDRVIKDIQNQLGKELKIFRGTLTRKSLQLQTINLPSTAQRMAWLAETLPRLPGSGIIYTLTVRDATRLAGFLRYKGIVARAYHGQLDNPLREQLEDELLGNQLKVLVATTALGMGFDKPDLGFVIHYQRPGSVVHYYQQVGRAGRAVDEAFGILLGGDEDEDITNYFIKTAFPPLAHTRQIIDVLLDGEGLSIAQIEQGVNLSYGQINKVLKLLSLESPAPVVKRGSKWYATPAAVGYRVDTDKIKKITRIREKEQAEMREYMNGRECLMQFLQRALDDPNPEPCGNCAICLKKPLLKTTVNSNLVRQATQYLKRTDQIIKPRKQFPPNALLHYRFNGNIKRNFQAEPGRALCLWGDSVWGEQVRRGKYQNHHFDDNLVEAVVEMIQRWQPQPFPKWVTCVPSLTRSELVPSLAARVARRLNVPFVPVVEKIRQTPPQKTMSNSYQQAHNLDGAFRIQSQRVRREPVFLIDDMVDSRWTFTVVAALLRREGSGFVFPVALALNSLG